jgi:16S rRNA (guanine527-N7)-methyltransferase
MSVQPNPPAAISHVLSADTEEKLSRYIDILLVWNERINLIAQSQTSTLWRRHIYDSLQLALYIPHYDSVVVDLGSGAGLPGMMLAIAGFANVHLVESDKRKCAFLQEVARHCGLSVTIHQERIEQCQPLNGDIVVSRACAPMAALLQCARRHSHSNSQYAFLKGNDVLHELSVAIPPSLTYSLFQSIVDPTGVVLTVSRS